MGGLPNSHGNPGHGSSNREYQNLKPESKTPVGSCLTKVYPSQALLAIQNSLPKEHVAVGTSMIVFMQNFGGTLMLSFGELVFIQALKNKILMYAPDVSAADVIIWGATGFRDHVSKKNLPGVLMAYDKAIISTLYLAVGCMVLAFCFTWGLGWKKVQSKAQDKEETAGEKDIKEGV